MGNYYCASQINKLLPYEVAHLFMRIHKQNRRTRECWRARARDTHIYSSFSFSRLLKWAHGSLCVRPTNRCQDDVVSSTGEQVRSCYPEGLTGALVERN